MVVRCGGWKFCNKVNCSASRCAWGRKFHNKGNSAWGWTFHKKGNSLACWRFILWRNFQSPHLTTTYRFFFLHTLPLNIVLKLGYALFYQFTLKLVHFWSRNVGFGSYVQPPNIAHKVVLHPLVEDWYIQNRWKSRKTLSGMQESAYLEPQKGHFKRSLVKIWMYNDAFFFFKLQNLLDHVQWLPGYEAIMKSSKSARPLSKENFVTFRLVSVSPGNSCFGEPKQ